MSHSTYKSTRKLVDQVEHEMLEGKEFIGTKTGFDELDRFLEGFYAGELILVGGRPSMGKTGFAISLIKNLCMDDNKSCLYFTLSESPKILIERIIKMVANMDVTDPQSLSPKKRERIKETAKAIRKSSLIIEGKSISIDSITRKCLKHSLQDKPDFIVIDYLQLIYSKDERSNDSQLLPYVKKLRKTARLIKCPIILLTQLPRTIEERANHRPMLCDLREYGLIEGYADKVIFLHRDEYYDFDTERKGIAEITVAKNRNGCIGTIELAHLGRGLLVSKPE